MFIGRGHPATSTLPPEKGDEQALVGTTTYKYDVKLMEMGQGQEFEHISKFQALIIYDRKTGGLCLLPLGSAEYELTQDSAAFKAAFVDTEKYTQEPSYELTMRVLRGTKRDLSHSDHLKFNRAYPQASQAAVLSVDTTINRLRSYFLMELHKNVIRVLSSNISLGIRIMPLMPTEKSTMVVKFSPGYGKITPTLTISYKAIRPAALVPEYQANLGLAQEPPKLMANEVHREEHLERCKKEIPAWVTTTHIEQYIDFLEKKREFDQGTRISNCLICAISTEKIKEPVIIPEDPRVFEYEYAQTLKENPTNRNPVSPDQIQIPTNKIWQEIMGYYQAIQTYKIEFYADQVIAQAMADKLDKTKLTQSLVTGILEIVLKKEAEKEVLGTHSMSFLRKNIDPVLSKAIYETVQQKLSAVAAPAPVRINAAAAAAAAAPPPVIREVAAVNPRQVLKDPAPPPVIGGVAAVNPGQVPKEQAPIDALIIEVSDVVLTVINEICMEFAIDIEKDLDEYKIGVESKLKEVFPEKKPQEISDLAEAYRLKLLEEKKPANPQNAAAVPVAPQLLKGIVAAAAAPQPQPAKPVNFYERFFQYLKDNNRLNDETIAHDLSLMADICQSRIFTPAEIGIGDRIKMENFIKDLRNSYQQQKVNGDVFKQR
jgi:hypothetical protein